MLKEQYVERQKKRYLAQLLEEFEQDVEPLIPPDVAAAFKGTVRRKMHALYLDSADMLKLVPGEVVNGYALELHNQLDANGQSRTRSQA